MKKSIKLVVQIAAVLAMTASANSAIAQERRGYDDNNRYDANERGDRHDRREAPGWAQVRVEEARYGSVRHTCDARRSVRRQVERNDGTVQVGNNLCGDPAPGAQKRLQITYRCGNREPQRIIAREAESLRLNCRR